MEQTSNHIDISKIRTFDEIFKDTQMFFKYNWKQFFSLLFLYVGPFLAVFQYTYSHYIALIYAQIETAETISFEIPTKEFWILAIFGIISFSLFHGISYSFITQYQTNTDTSRSSVISHFNQNLLLYISATITSTALLILGFLFYIIPGIILLFPLHFYVYDKLSHKGTFFETITRTFTMVKQNLGITIGTIITMQVLLFIIRLLISILFSGITSDSSIVSIIVSVILSLVTMGISVIPVVFLYHTIFKNTFEKKSYNN